MKNRVMILCLAMLAVGLAGCHEMGSGGVEPEVQMDLALPLGCGGIGQEPCFSCSEGMFLDVDTCVEQCPEPKVAEGGSCICPEGASEGPCASKLVIAPVKLAQIKPITIPTLKIFCQEPLVAGKDGTCGCPPAYPTISDDGKSCSDLEYESKLEGWWPCKAIDVKGSDPGCACPPFESSTGKACVSAVGIGKHDCPAPRVWMADGRCACPDSLSAEEKLKHHCIEVGIIKQDTKGDDAETGTSTESGSSTGTSTPSIVPPPIKLKAPVLLK